MAKKTKTAAAVSTTSNAPGVAPPPPSDVVVKPARAPKPGVAKAKPVIAPTPESKPAKAPKTLLGVAAGACLCCGQPCTGWFAPGHDSKAKSIIINTLFNGSVAEMFIRLVVQAGKAAA